jgi:hypothetical protein
MSRSGASKQLSREAFYRAVEEYSSAILSGRALSIDECLEIGRLWNTVLHDTDLQTEGEGKRFFELVRDRALPQLIATLHMSVGRGYSFHSDDFDFELGGILAERYRYRVESGH